MKLHYIINGTGLFAILSTALAQSGSKIWLADLNNHLVLQHICVQILFIVYLLYINNRETENNNQSLTKTLTGPTFQKRVLSYNTILFMATLIALTANYFAIRPLYISREDSHFSREDSHFSREDRNDESTKIPCGHGRNISLTEINLWSSNPYPKDLVTYLQKRNSDLIVLVEVTPLWERELNPLHKTYKYRITDVRKDNFGLAIYSKFPVIKSKIHRTDAKGRPIIHCKVQLPSEDLGQGEGVAQGRNVAQGEGVAQGRDVSQGEELPQGPVIDLFAIHPTPPKHPSYFKLRTKYFAYAVSIIKETILTGQPNSHTIVAGDFNCPHWSPYFKSLLDKTNLLDTGAGFGLCPTWPTLVPFLMEPIDHCLVSEKIRVIERKTGPFLWSDHLPLELNLIISGE